MLPSTLLALGWALWSGGPSSAPASRRSVENATSSVFRWAGAPVTLRWALAPDFCTAVSPLLWEENTMGNFVFSKRSNFTQCRRIRALVRQSFALWSAANPGLHFIDVTDRCAVERLWRPLSEQHCSESAYCIDEENGTDWKIELTQFEQRVPAPSTEECSFVTSATLPPTLTLALTTSPVPSPAHPPTVGFSQFLIHQLRTCFDCERAQVVVGGFTQKNRRLGDQHAYGRVTRTLTDEQPLGTNGLPNAHQSIALIRSPLEPLLFVLTGRAMYGKSVKRAFLEINMDDEYKTVESDGGGATNATVVHCWRLDSDVCDWMATVLFWIFFSLVLTTFCIGCCMAMHRFASNLLTGWDVDQNGKLELNEACTSGPVPLPAIAIC
ncbi:MAG: hypothetical protein SGPRY_009114, partial [Prymnesium sp.]